MVVIVHLFWRHFRSFVLSYERHIIGFFPVVFWGSAVVEFLSARGLLQSLWRRILIDVFFSISSYHWPLRKSSPYPTINEDQWRGDTVSYPIPLICWLISGRMTCQLFFNSYRLICLTLVTDFFPNYHERRIILSFTVYLLLVKTRWWFQICFMFTPIWGRFPIFDSYFSAGLKAPTTKRLFSPTSSFQPLWGWHFNVKLSSFCQSLNTIALRKRALVVSSAPLVVGSLPCPAKIVCFGWGDSWCGWRGNHGALLKLHWYIRYTPLMLYNDFPFTSSIFIPSP